MSETTLGALASSGVLSLGDGYRTRQSELADSGYQIIRVADVRDGRVAVDSPDFVDAAFERQIGVKAARAGDVLLTTKGTVGRVAVVPELSTRAVYSPQLCWFRVLDPGQLNSRFLSYWLQAPSFLAQASYLQGNTDMAPYISLSDLRGSKITLPRISEQRAIAEVLGALDDKIAANAVLVDAQLRLVNTEFSRRFGARRLGKPLGGLADVVDCLHSRKPEQLLDGPVLLQLNNIRNDGLIDRTFAYNVSEQDYVNWSRRFETRAWDLVITNVGRIGAVARIPQAFTVALGRNMTGIRPRDAAESGSFVAAALFSAAVRREIELRTDAGSVMNALNVRSIPLLRLQVSTPSERRLFHEFAAPFYESADAALLENEALAATRDALLPQLMSGKLRVRDAEAAASAVGA